MNWKRLLVLLILAALAGIEASAQPEPPSPQEEQEAQADQTGEPQEGEEPETTVAEEIFVTATRVEASRETLGSSTTLIDSEQIEESRKTSALEVLRSVPGLEVNQSGGPGTSASAFLRGAASGQTLVLIDGVRVNSVTGASADLADIRVDNVGRIEIVRGPQSTLYGSEAIGGVINIITRRGEPGFRSTLNLEAGDNDLYEGRLSLNGGSARLDYSVATAWASTDGISAASERAGNSEADAYENFTASGRFGFAFLEDGRVDLALRTLDATVDLDGFSFGIGPVDDLNYEQDHQALYATFEIEKPLTEWWQQSLTVGLQDDDIEGLDPDTVFNNYLIETRFSNVIAQSDFFFAENQITTLGYSYEEREGSSEGSFDQKIDISSLFLQHQWSWNERLFLTGGVRNDDHSQFGSETTYRFTAAALLAGGATRLHGSYGTGFRAPSLNELYFPGFGNLDLRPETSRGFDLGVEQKLLGDKLRIDLTYFDNQFEDLIGFDFVTFQANNIAEAEASGVEALLYVTPGSRFDLTASYTYTDSENLTTGLQLPRRPKNRGSLFLAFRPIEPLTGTLLLIVVKDRIDSDASPLDDYERVDLSLSYDIGNRLTPYLRIQNLLDEDYEEVRGFTSPGITPAIGVKARLR
ncbi:MAG TPA: TonB-dependent receptor [Thermoanaerobaculia bacterium]